VPIDTALKTIQGICGLYDAPFYVDLGERIAVYHVLNDSFHVFQWVCEKGRYVWIEERDTIPNWIENKVRISSCTKLDVPELKLEKHDGRSTAA
jgi:hypothetical protein